MLIQLERMQKRTTRIYCKTIGKMILEADQLTLKRKYRPGSRVSSQKSKK
jgi:hypothetical protein